MLQGTSVLLNVQFGGFDASIIGSGTATGSAGVQALYSAPSSFSASYITTPSYSTSLGGSLTQSLYSGSKLSASTSLFSLQVGVTAKMTFLLTVGPQMSFTFNVQTTPSLTYTYGQTSFSFEVLVKKPKQEDVGIARSLADASPLIPGTEVPIEIKYSHLPLEKSIFFYSITDGETVFPIDMQYVEPTELSGKIHTKWIVPADVTMSPRTTISSWKVNVKSSYDLTTEHAINDVDIAPLSADVAIVSFPKDGDILYSGKQYEITWNPKALNYFVQTDIFSQAGYPVISKTVNIYIVVADIRKERTLLTEERRMLVAMNIPNSGSASVTFSSAMVSSTHHFYIVVRSVERSNLYGWSSGKFALWLPGWTHVKMEESTLAVGERTKALVSTTQPKMSSQITSRKLAAICGGGTGLTASVSGSVLFVNGSAAIPNPVCDCVPGTDICACFQLTALYIALYSAITLPVNTQLTSFIAPVTTCI